MDYDEAVRLLSVLHKNKEFRPSEDDRKFLEDLWFYTYIGKIEISEVQGTQLKRIYEDSQGG